MKIRTLPVLLALAALAFALAPGRAQAAGTTILTDTDTNAIAGVTTNIGTTIVAVADSQHCWLGASFKMSASSTSNITFAVSGSYDAANWMTNAYSFTIAGNGTTATSAYFCITNAPPFIGYPSIFNPHASAAVTNCVFKSFTKRGI